MLSAVLAAGATLSVEGVATRDAGSASTAEQPLPWLTRLSPADEQSVASLGAALAKEPDLTIRARALHDWLVTRLRYVADGQEQSVAEVLRRRTASCEGYARAFQALGRAAGLEVVRIVGLARDAVGAPRAHAWNAVRLGGRWRLVDVTFDDPQVAGALGGDDGFRTDYFLITPEIALLDHLPDQPHWLLGQPALTRAQFLAQGPERASSRRLGITPGPARFQGEQVVVPVKNLTGRFLLLRVDAQRCGPVVTGSELELPCTVQGAGPHHFELFSNDRAEGLFRTVAEWISP